MTESSPRSGDAVGRAGGRSGSLAETDADSSADRLAQVDRLAEYRDAGLLTDSELEEQMEKLRWGPIPARPAAIEH